MIAQFLMYVLLHAVFLSELGMYKKNKHCAKVLIVWESICHIQVVNMLIVYASSCLHVPS